MEEKKRGSQELAKVKKLFRKDGGLAAAVALLNLVTAAGLDVLSPAYHKVDSIRRPVRLPKAAILSPERYYYVYC